MGVADNLDTSGTILGSAGTTSAAGVPRPLPLAVGRWALPLTIGKSLITLNGRVLIMGIM